MIRKITDEDVKWLMNSCQRHTGGFDAWIKQCTKEGIAWPDILQIILQVWEAGEACEKTNHL